MTIGQGVAKQLRVKRQSAKGSLAGTSGGQILRRETAKFELQKETYTTESEITSKRQLTSNRHGVRLVNGDVAGILSPGTYAEILSAILMRDFTAVSALTGLSLTVAGAGPTYTITRAAGDFLAGGFKVGMVVRLTAGSLNAANLNKNLWITAVTATVLTVMPLNGVALVAEGPIASCTATVPGKITYVPETGHTNFYYTVEEWYSDVPYSERNLDVKFLAATLALPGTGNAKISLSALGLNQTNDPAAYFTAPSAESTSQALVAASGLLSVNGTVQAVVTDLNIVMDSKGTAADGVVGSDIRPDVFTGKVMVTGSFTAYFDSGTIPALFTSETALAIHSALVAGSDAAADFMAISLSRIKLNTSTPDDGEVGLKRTYSFVAEYNSAGGAALANQATTVQVQDSLAA